MEYTYGTDGRGFESLQPHFVLEGQVLKDQFSVAKSDGRANWGDSAFLTKDKRLGSAYLNISIDGNRALVPSTRSVFDERQHVGTSQEGRLDTRHEDHVSRGRADHVTHIHFVSTDDFP